VSDDGSFYTLTYSPRDYHFDNKWHKVRVRLSNGDYHLSYRRGYFADGTVGSAEEPHKATTRTRLLPSGEKVQLPETRSTPIIFQARVLPASDPEVVNAPPASGTLLSSPPKKGTVPFSIRYSIPTDAVTAQPIKGLPTVTMGIAAVVVNSEGRADDAHAERVQFALNEDAIRQHPELQLAFTQVLNLKKSDQYLYLAVWDMTSGRLGTIQIPVQVPKPVKTASTP